MNEDRTVKWEVGGVKCKMEEGSCSEVRFK